MIDYKELGTKLAELVAAYTASCSTSVYALTVKGAAFDDACENIQKSVQILSDGTINLSALTALSYLTKSLADEVDGAARKSAKQITDTVFDAMTKRVVDAHIAATKRRPGATNTETANDQD